ncbi:hypothetical protein JOB18_022686 [Scomber scombrus]|uniref:Uncharacterized protein n=1 Tax=Scomber scombrus TaxID=13677 RepID=A0AAV1Q0V7_SCOSC
MNGAHSHSSTGSYCQQVEGLEVNPALFVAVLVCADIWIIWMGGTGSGHRSPPTSLKSNNRLQAERLQVHEVLQPASDNKQPAETDMKGKD